MRWMVLAACAGLGACQAPTGNGANAANEMEMVAVDPGNLVVLPDIVDETELTDPPKRGEEPGGNEMSTAIPGLYYYRDLPAAYWLRGAWTVRNTEWFAVGGGETPARVPARLKAFEGAAIRIDRQAIVVTPRVPAQLARVTLDCKGVGYIGKDALFAAETAPGRANSDTTTREDVLHNWSVAVAERELSRVFAKSQTVRGQVMSLLCPESDTGDAEAGDYPDAYISGAMLIDRNRMVLLFTDGTALYATRDAQ